jgi:hypothetical protein
MTSGARPCRADRTAEEDLALDQPAHHRMLLLWLWRAAARRKWRRRQHGEGLVSEIWSALGNFFAKKLPNGVELNIPELGVEN